MIIEACSNEAKCSLTIRTFVKDETSESGSHQNLDKGEWMLVESNNVKTLYFCISDIWNQHEIAHHFRVLAYKTKKFWGENPCFETSLHGDELRASLRGFFLSSYHPKNGMSKNNFQQKTLYLKAETEFDKILNRSKVEADAQMWAMELVDLPPNVKTPEYLGAAARASAKRNKYDCEVWNDDHIVKAKLHALHAVGKGSEHEPVFIISRYMGRSETKDMDLALVGKGITFDTGGISIKNSANMHYMKSDMAGAAAMLAAIELAARLELELNIAVVVPSAENSVDARSLLPGDVIDSYSGKTIEIIDTDAEGRLVLSDGLAWTIKNLKPAVVLDMATLTGSSVRALGMEAAALYSDNENLVSTLYESGQKSGEKLWRMPLWDDYNSYLDSDVADLSNLSLKPIAGSIAAAKFLQVFTDNHTAWAHIDMPGMSFKDSPFNKMKSATGYGVQLLNDFMHKLEQNVAIDKA